MTIKRRTKRRILRVLAICLGIGIISPSAGSALGMDFATSVAFGALNVGIAIVSALLIIFGVDDGVDDAKFNKTLKDAVDKAKPQQKKD